MSSDDQEVRVLTSKEIKKIAKPKFAANPELYYPVETMKKLGYSRAQCSKCGEYFWRHSDKVETCGDSECVGKYEFIGRGTGIGRGPNGHKITYAEAWEGFKRSLTSARIPATAIHRYPVVARWRSDVDYVAAGIYCFQPYCVTGELDPPANPLICPQFCLRFNDLDNIGLSGRHFSGFVMLGIQVFNTPEKYVFFKDECVEFNLRWLHEELGIPLDEITLVEDVWCGGGNIGPSVEYFIGGLEIGNMVFMQYKVTDPTVGAFEPLKVQVIDVGIGLERIPWLINGAPTSYVTTFPKTLEFLSKRLGVPYVNPVMEKFGPYSCVLNMDELQDVDAAWTRIAALCGMESKEALLAGISPVRDLYIVCDHTRTVLMAIEDGSLPSSVGGAANLRNVLRRAFMVLRKNGWWEKLGGMDGFLELFQHHREELAELYGPFEEYKSFDDIIRVEYKRWLTTDDKVKSVLNAYVKKKKGKPLTVQDWLEITKSHGISADAISELLKAPIPDNYFTLWAELSEQKVRAPPEQLYDTTGLPPTRELYYEEEDTFAFDAKVVKVLEKMQSMGRHTGEHSIVVLDQTCFYPYGGGQDEDHGALTLDGQTYDVVYVEKVGKAILHHLSRPLPRADIAAYEGMEARGVVDSARRYQLRNHHTATHIIHQAARKVLGPHIWQAGAKKTVEAAHLDITHYAALTEEQEQQIEFEANLAVRKGFPITKTWLPKEQAEKEYGFKLYQGGVVAGNVVRVVDINGYDTEACCGTHCHTTSEVGLIRVIRSNRISDGIVRIHFVAGDRALQYTNEQSALVHSMCDLWGVQPADILATATRIFTDYKKLSALAKKQALDVIQLQTSLFLRSGNEGASAAAHWLIRSDEPNPTIYHSALNAAAQKLKDSKKAIVVLGKTFVHALIGDPSILALEDLEKAVAESYVVVSRADRKKKAEAEAEDGAAPAPAPAPAAAPAVTPKPLRKSTAVKIPVKGKKPINVDGILLISGDIGANQQPVFDFFAKKGFAEIKFTDN